MGSLTLSSFVSFFLIISLLLLASNSPASWRLVVAVAGLLSVVFSVVLLALVLVLFHHPAQRLRLNELLVLPVDNRAVLP